MINNITGFGRLRGGGGYHEAGEGRRAGLIS